MFSTSLNRRSENVIVEAIVIPKLELCNVKWQVFGANLVESADDTALEYAPEALNGASVKSRIIAIARSKATKQSMLTSRLYGLLRGACHRARIRATR